jgi:general secretion pathway protein M
MMGNSEVLRTVLYKIETSIPLIIIDQIDIRSMQHGTMSLVPNKIDSSNKLNVNFQAVSFMRKPTE